MNRKSGKKDKILAENWEDSTLRQTFFLYKQEIESPTCVWGAIYAAASLTEGKQATSASYPRLRFIQRFRKIFQRSIG